MSKVLIKTMISELGAIIPQDELDKIADTSLSYRFSTFFIFHLITSFSLIISLRIIESLMIVIGVDGTILVGLKTYPSINEAIRMGSMIKQNLKFIFIISI